MRFSLIAVFVLFTGPYVAQADVIWLKESSITTTAHIGWLDQYGTLQTADATAHSAFAFTESIGAGVDERRAPKEMRIGGGEFDTELGAGALSLALGYGVYGSAAQFEWACENYSAVCDASARIDIGLKFLYAGSEGTYLHWNPEYDARAFYSLLFTDHTRDTVIADLRIDRTNYTSSFFFDLEDGHLYSAYVTALTNSPESDHSAEMALVFDSPNGVPDVVPPPVPEPSTIFLIGSGIVAAITRRRRSASRTERSFESLPITIHQTVAE